jgi:hypothetical protein
MPVVPRRTPGRDRNVQQSYQLIGKKSASETVPLSPVPPPEPQRFGQTLFSRPRCQRQNDQCGQPAAAAYAAKAVRIGHHLTSQVNTKIVGKKVMMSSLTAACNGRGAVLDAPRLA